MEATYEQLLPGSKRDNRGKMEACRKDYNDIRSTFLQQEQILETQKNKEQLAFTTTEGVSASIIFMQIGCELQNARGHPTATSYR